MRARKKARLRALHVGTNAELEAPSAAPPRPERPFLDDVREGVRTARFRMAAVRQVIMLAGVFALDWPALELVVFFLLEAFLFLSLRAALELNLDPKRTVPGRPPMTVALDVAMVWLVAAPIVCLLMAAFGALLILPAFPAAAWTAFLGVGIRSPSFQASLAILAATVIYDMALFARRVAAGRGTAERTRDDGDHTLVLARVGLLAAFSILLGVAAHLGLGPKVLALGIAAALLYVEMVPQRTAQLLGARSR